MAPLPRMTPTAAGRVSLSRDFLRRGARRSYRFAMKQIVERAHAHGIKVIGCTLTPYEGAGYYSEKGEEVRQAVNRWIRTAGAFDAVADFEKATQDSANPKTFKATFNNGDHLHPN